MQTMGSHGSPVVILAFRKDESPRASWLARLAKSESFRFWRVTLSIYIRQRDKKQKKTSQVNL